MVSIALKNVGFSQVVQLFAPSHKPCLRTAPKNFILEIRKKRIVGVNNVHTNITV